LVRAARPRPVLINQHQSPLCSGRQPAARRKQHSYREANPQNTFRSAKKGKFCHGQEQRYLIYQLRTLK
jgi:hypothetical protein